MEGGDNEFSVPKTWVRSRDVYLEIEIIVTACGWVDSPKENNIYQEEA